MGASGSKNAVAPILPATQLSAAQVAEAVKALGVPYAPYAEKLEENGMDGPFLDAITTDDLPGLLADIGVTSTFHQKKLEVVFNSFKAGGGGVNAIQAPTNTRKAFAAFLSHYKLECGTEARLVQQTLKPIFEESPIEGSSNEVFLDSDDLSDLRKLLLHVVQTKVLVLLQSKGVLTRPWVIMELHTAITNDVPIVALNIQKDSCPYDYAEASEFLLHFDQDIEVANPGAAQLLIDMGIDPVDVAYRLSDCLPNIISTDFNPNGSERQIQASLGDLVDSMRKALPIAPSMTKEEWLEKRKTHKRSAVATAGRKAHGSSEAPASALVTNDIAEIPATVPDLPGAYLVRESDLSQLREALLVIEGSASLTSKEAQKKTKKPQNKVGAHGMVSSSGRSVNIGAPVDILAR